MSTTSTAIDYSVLAPNGDFSSQKAESFIVFTADSMVAGQLDKHIDDGVAIHNVSSMITGKMKDGQRYDI